MNEAGVLAMMVMASRQEREAGFPGWVQAPAECAGICDLLVEGGLAEEGEPGWFRPTREGERWVSENVQPVPVQ